MENNEPTITVAEAHEKFKHLISGAMLQADLLDYSGLLLLIAVANAARAALVFSGEDSFFLKPAEELFRETKTTPDEKAVRSFIFVPAEESLVANDAA